MTSTPENRPAQGKAQRITPENQPVFPCWLWHPEFRWRLIDFHACPEAAGWTHWIAWTPALPAAPTEIPAIPQDSTPGEPCGGRCGDPRCELDTVGNPLPQESVGAQEDKPCTCHPDDNPPKPCAKQYALSECRAAHPQGQAQQELRDRLAIMLFGLPGTDLTKLDAPVLDAIYKKTDEVISLVRRHAPAVQPTATPGTESAGELIERLNKLLILHESYIAKDHSETCSTEKVFIARDKFRAAKDDFIAALSAQPVNKETKS